MNRIGTTFERLRREGNKGLVGYLTAGDPDLETSERNIRDAIEAGLDVLELGVPFSDPTADGPTIQAAAHRALAAGMTPRTCLGLVERLRRDYDLPIILFGYLNPFFIYGYESLCADAAAAGVDGFLAVDLPAEERAELDEPARAAGLDLIPLVAPTTPPERLPLVLDGVRGFVYYVMVKGVTGARAATAVDVDEHVATLREYTDLPIAVGFGVSDGPQAAAAGRAADAVVVGSALVRAASEGRVAPLVRELASALHTGGCTDG